MANFVETPLSKTSIKYLTVGFVAMSLSFLNEYYSDHALRHACGSIGFALVAFATYKNGFSFEGHKSTALYASVLGVAFLLASAIASTAPAVAGLIAMIR